MVKFKNYFWLFIVSFSILIYTGCSSDKSDVADENSQNLKSEINAELLQEQNDLYEKVCKDFSDINQKVTELNNKIRSMEGKLNDAQNSAIDEVEKMRTSVNNRMHNLKKISPEDWESFKVSLENDIVDVKSQIDEIINDIK